MILELGCYQIRHGKEGGFVLWKFEEGGEVIPKGPQKGQVVKAGWKPMGKYPHNYGHALNLIADDYARLADGKKAVREGLEDVANYIRDIAESARILDGKGGKA